MLIDGTYKLLYIKTTETGGNFLPIGCLTEQSFSESSETIETTTRDNLGWKSFLPTYQSFNISFSGLDTTTLVGVTNYSLLETIKANRELIEWRIGTTTDFFSGKGYIIDLSREYPTDDLVTFNGTLEGYGVPMAETVINATDVDYVAVLNYALNQGITIPSASQQALQEQIVIDLKAAGVWTKLDSLVIWATENSDFALIDWKKLSLMTAFNSPTFTTNVGYQGNLTSAYIDLGFSPSTAGNYALSDASFGVWYGNVATRTVGAIYFGFSSLNVSSNNFLFPVSTGGYLRNINGTAGGGGTVGKTLVDGLYVATRNNNTTLDTYLNGASLDSSLASTEAVTLGTTNFTAFARNFNGTIDLFSDDQIRMLYVGQHLTSTEVSDFYTAINTYMTSL